jgi:hypothetical protein
VRGLDHYAAVESYPLRSHVFRLTEAWVAEVTQSGLWVRPPGREAGAEIVRALPWTPGTVRIFVGLPGDPPGYHVLPLLGALLGRMPAETRRRVHLSPALFEAARPGDEPLPEHDGTTPADPGWAIRRAVLLREPPSVAAGTPRPGAAPTVDRSAADRAETQAGMVRSDTAPAVPDGAPASAAVAGGGVRPDAPRPVAVRRPPSLPGQAERAPRPFGPVDDPTIEFAARGARRTRTRRRSTLTVLAVATVVVVAATAGIILSLPGTRSDAGAPSVKAAPPAYTPASPTALQRTPGWAAADPTVSIAAADPSGTDGAPPAALPTQGTQAGTSPTPVAGALTSSPPPASPTVMPGLVNDSGRNLALIGTASASTVEPPGVFAIANANDGNPLTRWGSAFAADPQWLAIDLGAVWQVTEVRLLWEEAYATEYRIELSLDGRSWQTVYRTGSGSGGTVQVAVTRTPARYVRMVGTARRMDGYGYSLYELEVR